MYQNKRAPSHSTVLKESNVTTIINTATNWNSPDFQSFTSINLFNPHTILDGKYYCLFEQPELTVVKNLVIQTFLF